MVNPETYQDVPDGQQGLLLAKGPGVMKGYYNNPQGTDKAFQDGWFDTGDLGWRAPGMISSSHKSGYHQLTVVLTYHKCVLMLLTTVVMHHKRVTNVYFKTNYKSGMYTLLSTTLHDDPPCKLHILKKGSLMPSSKHDESLKSSLRLSHSDGAQVTLHHSMYVYLSKWLLTMLAH